MNYSQVKIVHAEPSDYAFSRSFFTVPYEIYPRYREKNYTYLPALSLAYSVQPKIGDLILHAGFAVRSPKDKWDRKKGRSLAILRHDQAAVKGIYEGFQFACPVMPILQNASKLPFLETIAGWIDFRKIPSPYLLTWHALDCIAIHHASALNAHLRHYHMEGEREEEIYGILINNIIHASIAKDIHS